jgi:HAD superfamily hydrolase (TIGR01549 family)
MKINAIIYDFDGVILDSVSIKTKAFKRLYSQYGEKIQQYVVQYHLHHGGVSRYEKISHYHQKLLGIKLGESELELLAQQFAKYVSEALLACPFVTGAEEFITRNAPFMPQMIASGAPEVELRNICENKKIDKYFVDISGSPTHKNDIVAFQVEKYSLNPKHTLMIGDSITDYEAAKANGLHFIQVSTDGNPSITGVHHAVSDLMQLQPISYAK